MRKVTIGDLGDIYTGNTPSKKNVEFYDSEDIMFIKPDILDFDINTINESNEYVSERAREKARIIPKDSLLVSCIGNIGKLGINKKEAAFNQQINAIVHNEKIVSSRYLAYLIKYNQKKLEAIANAPVVPIINKTQFSNFELFIHENLETQNKIVEVLDKAQSLIDKKREQIELLDELVKSRFIEMFGDPILNPKEWQTEKLGNISKISRGGSPRPIDKFLGGTIPWIKIGDATAGDDIYIYDTKEKIIEEGVKKSRLIKKGGLIFANCGVSLGFARILKIDGCIHDGWLAFEDFEEHLDKIFFLKSLNYCTEYFRKTAPDGTQPNLNTNIMKEYVQILPPMEKQKEFSSFIEKIDEIKSKMETSLSELEDNFNSLMQKAFKGELF